MEWKTNYNINKNHFLYIIYISCFPPLPLPPPTKYKHGKKNEVTVNVQVPKQKYLPNTEHMPLALVVGGLVWCSGMDPWRPRRVFNNSKPLSHHSGKKIIIGKQ